MSLIPINLGHRAVYYFSEKKYKIRSGGGGGGGVTYRQRCMGVQPKQRYFSGHKFRD